MEYTMSKVQNQGDATTGREISRATGNFKKSKLFFIELTSLSSNKFTQL